MLHEEALTEQIIGASIEVHRSLGTGLLESAYQACTAREFALRGFPFEQELPLPLEYKGVRVDSGYRLDFIVAGKVVVELKTVESLQPVHEAQLLTSLRLTGCKVGLLVNFNVPFLKHGSKRMVL
jgi:GxxExxY protein